MGINVGPRSLWIALALGALVLLISASGSGLLQSRAQAQPESAGAYPNLRAQPARDFRFDVVDVQVGGAIVSKEVIRLSVTSTNDGLGPLDLIAGAPEPGTGKQSVSQRFLLADGGWDTYEHAAGAFSWHDGHNHFHIDEYALFSLHEADDPSFANERARGVKTTFCIMDTTKVDTKLSGAPKRATYRTCGAVNQGMSVGWGDTYGYQLVDQWIDVTSLVGDAVNNGAYVIRVEIDPAGNIEERDRAGQIADDDNVSTVAVCIDFLAREISLGDCESSDDGNSGRPGNGNGRGNRPTR